MSDDYQRDELAPDGAEMQAPVQKLWTDGTETYVAESVERARAMQVEYVGHNHATVDDWYEHVAAGAWTIQQYDGHNDVTRTSEEWIEANGPGFLCSTDW